MKIFRDNKVVFDYAKETAFDEGKKEVVKSAKQMGLSTADIIKLTGLSQSEIDNF